MRRVIVTISGRACIQVTACELHFWKLMNKKSLHAYARRRIHRRSLISQIALPELAPCNQIAGCRASQGRFPPPLWIRHLFSCSGDPNARIAGSSSAE
jgi:hypothetical protein